MRARLGSRLGWQQLSLWARDWLAARMGRLCACGWLRWTAHCARQVGGGPCLVAGEGVRQRLLTALLQVLQGRQRKGSARGMADSAGARLTRS